MRRIWEWWAYLDRTTSWLIVGFILLVAATIVLFCLCNKAPQHEAEFARLATAEGNITQQGTDIVQLQADFGKLQTGKEQLQGDIAQLKIDVAILQTAKGQLQGDIAQLKIDMAKLQLTPAPCPCQCTYRDLNVGKWVRVYGSSAWVDSVTVRPGQRIEFKIEIASTGIVYNTMAKVILPSQFNSHGNLKLDGSSFSGDIVTGVNIGTLCPGRTRTLTFDVGLCPQSSQYSCGTTRFDCAIQVWADCAGAKTDKIAINVYRSCPSGEPSPPLPPVCPPGGPGPDPP